MRKALSVQYKIAFIHLEVIQCVQLVLCQGKMNWLSQQLRGHALVESIMNLATVGKAVKIITGNFQSLYYSAFVDDKEAGSLICNTLKDKTKAKEHTAGMSVIVGLCRSAISCCA